MSYQYVFGWTNAEVKFQYRCSLCKEHFTSLRPKVGKTILCSNCQARISNKKRYEKRTNKKNGNLPRNN